MCKSLGADLPAVLVGRVLALALQQGVDRMHVAVDAERMEAGQAV